MQSQKSASGVPYAAWIELPGNLAEPVQEALAAMDLAAAAWEDADTDQGRVEIFADSARAAAGDLATLQAVAAEVAGPAGWQSGIRRLAAENWQESWKRFFRVERVSRRIVIRPSWEPFTAQPGDIVVDIDPGMSFGTGQHGTTRACLQHIDRLAAEGPRGSFLDLGCGSGILAVAAAKLGFAPVAAVDSDPLAVAIAGENLTRNGVADRVACGPGDAAHPVAGGPYGAVVANILADVLDRDAPAIASNVAPGGRLVLSGLLDRQYASARRRYEALGFRELTRTAIDEWVTGAFRRD